MGESVGIRLNRKKPNIYFKHKKGGGVAFNAVCPLTKVDEKLVQLILHEYKIFNAEVLFREDCSADDLIDVISDNRIYLQCLYVYNKIDQISLEEVDRIARQPHSVVVSCNMKLNLDYLLETLWEYLSFIRVYTKKPGQPPDFNDCLILRKGVSVEHVCHSIHRTLAEVLKYALVWGTSAKFNPQRVGSHHIVLDEDVIQIVKKGKFSFFWLSVLSRQYIFTWTGISPPFRFVNNFNSFLKKKKKKKFKTIFSQKKKKKKKKKK